MSDLALVIGGERSSGKTTLVNYLVSGIASSPFPRGVRGRGSRINVANFLRSEHDSSSGLKSSGTLRISTHGPNKKEIEIRACSGDCSDLLMLTAHDIQQHLLRLQPENEPTCLTLAVCSESQHCIDLITEVGPDCLRAYVDLGSLEDPMVSSKVENPDLYVHLTSAIKPLAYVERQAILKFLGEKIPVMLFVNKCDLVDDGDSLEEVDGLVSVFSSVDCDSWLPNYLCSFTNNVPHNESVLSIEEVADLIYGALSGRLGKARSKASLPEARSRIGQKTSDLDKSISPMLDPPDGEDGDISI